MIIPLPFLLQASGLLLVSLTALPYLLPQPAEAPNAPDTIRLPLPNPPFTGGQCEGITYVVTATCVLTTSGGINLLRTQTQSVVVGAVTRVEFVYYPPESPLGAGRHSWYLEVDGGGGTSRQGQISILAEMARENLAGWTWAATNVIIQRQDGLPDTCGNRGERPIPETGLADTVININEETFNDNSVTIFEGGEYDNDTTTNIFNDASDLTTEAIAALPVAVPAGLVKAVAALSKIVDALQLMDGVLRLLREQIGKDNKSVRMYTYGRIVGDGFLRLYPTGNPTEYEGISVELVALEIPSERGRIFGRHSPNRFKYEPLGRIMFTSGAMGIISTHDIEYPRVSIPIPLGATGFFYHLGLHNNVAFNAVGVYYRIERSLGG